MSHIGEPENDPRAEGPVEEERARRFGWWDMFVHPDDDPRTDGGFQGERATLVGDLRDQRLTLELKCSGLDAADLARLSVEPSNLSLLGLVRHLAGVEQTWFRLRMAGQDAPRHFRSDADPTETSMAQCPTPRSSPRRRTPGVPRSSSRSSSWPRRLISTSSGWRATACGRCWCT